MVMSNENVVVRLLRKVVAIGLLCVMAPICHIVYARLAWEDSVGEFHEVLNIELHTLVLMSNTRVENKLTSLVESVLSSAYSVSGINDQRAVENGRFIQHIVVDQWEYVQILLISIQLIVLRMGVIVLSAPLIMGMVVVGLSNGIAIWYLRRSAGSRDSAFIYHRVKGVAYYSVVIFAMTYFYAPVVMNPIGIVPAFSIVYGASVTLALGFFKKYV